MIKIVSKSFFLTLILYTSAHPKFSPSLFLPWTCDALLEAMKLSFVSTIPPVSSTVCKF